MSNEVVSACVSVRTVVVPFAFCVLRTTPASVLLGSIAVIVPSVDHNMRSVGGDKDTYLENMVLNFPSDAL